MMTMEDEFYQIIINHLLCTYLLFIFIWDLVYLIIIILFNQPNKEYLPQVKKCFSFLQLVSKSNNLHITYGLKDPIEGRRQR